jgi:hypothetical protein
METRSFVILAENKSSVESQIEKLNKRAAKMGLGAITCSWGKAFVETREVLYQDPRYPDSDPSYIKKELLVIPVDICGPLDVSFDGWKFIATLQHLPTGENIIRSISDVEIPKIYREAGCNCQHCNTNRYRKDTYLVCHEETGAIVQVGSTCIKDFLGGNSPDNIMNKANLIAELISFMNGSGNEGSGELAFHIETFLAVTSACIRDHGWVSKSKASTDGGTPTVEWVTHNLFKHAGSREKDLSTVENVDKELAKKAAEWAENISDEECDKSDYLYNIRAIARSGMVGVRVFGFAASIIAAYNRAHDIRTNSAHVGNVGERKVFELIFQKCLYFDSMYGTTAKYIFADIDGNILTWSTTSQPKEAKVMKENKKYTVQGTIKRHIEYKGTPQTELTRCKILTVYPSDGDFR